MGTASLDEYLNQTMARPWSWGGCDCFVFLSDWVRLRTGIDPASDYRGRYDSERQARRLIKEAGGMPALVGAGVAKAGMVPTEFARRGDVGLVRVALRRVGDRVIFVPMCAICLVPLMWAIKPAHGPQLVAQRFPLLIAWGLPAASTLH